MKEAYGFKKKQLTVFVARDKIQVLKKRKKRIGKVISASVIAP